MDRHLIDLREERLDLLRHVYAAWWHMATSNY